MPLSVPPPHVAHVKKLLELQEDSVNAFIAALAKAKPHFNLRDLGDEVSQVSNLPRELVSGVVQVLGSLYLTKDSQDTPLKNFVDEGVQDALKASNAFDKDRMEEQWAKLRQFLLSGLSLEDTLGTAAKAGYVHTQHERIFFNARIMTDVRHIFHQDVAEKPQAALLVHMLRITERDNQGHKWDKYFALDSNDLRKMRALIDRALKKEETLKQLTEKSGVALIDPKANF